MIYSSIIKNDRYFAFVFYCKWFLKNYRDDIVYPFGIGVLIPAAISRASVMLYENKSVRRKDTWLNCRILDIRNKGIISDNLEVEGIF